MEHSVLRPLAACCAAVGRAYNWIWEHVLWPLCDALGTVFNAIGTAVGAVFDALGTAVGAIGRVVGRVVGARRPEPDGPNLATTTLT